MTSMLSCSMSCFSLSLSSEGLWWSGFNDIPHLLKSPGFRDNRSKAPGAEGNQYTSHPSSPLTTMWWWLDNLSPWGQGLCLLTLAPFPHHLVTWWKYSILYLFDEFLKASVSFHCIDRKKDSGKRCQLPSGTRHGILAALEGMWLFGCLHLNPFLFRGNSLPDKELKQPLSKQLKNASPSFPSLPCS